MARVQSPCCRSPKSLPLWHHSARLPRGQWVNCPCFPTFASPLLCTFRREVGGGGKIISRGFFFPKLLPLAPLTYILWDHSTWRFTQIHWMHILEGVKMIRFRFLFSIVLPFSISLEGNGRDVVSTEMLGFLSLPAVTSGTLGLDLWGGLQDHLWVSKIPWMIARCKPRPSHRQISHKIIVCVKDSHVVYLANGFELNSLTCLNSFHMNWQAMDQDILGSLNSCI